MGYGKEVENREYLYNLLNVLKDSYEFMDENGIEKYDLKTCIKIMTKNNLNEFNIIKTAQSTKLTNRYYTFTSQLQLNWSNEYPKSVAEKYTRNIDDLHEYRNIINSFVKNNNIFGKYYNIKNFKINKKRVGDVYVKYFYTNWEEIETCNIPHEWDEQFRKISKQLLRKRNIDIMVKNSIFGVF